MADNVFGNPVTDATVRLIYPDKKVTTRKDRAAVAFQYKNAESKDVNVKKFVHNLKERYGNGISTLCMIYNATGDTLTYDRDKDWHGHIGETPYPSQIQNGQWAGFLHVHSSGAATGSEAAVVYRGKNDAGAECDWLLAWDGPYIGSNRVYTQVREAGHYESDHWDDIQDSMEDQSGHDSSTWNGCYSIVSIGQSSSPEFVATMTLAGVA